MAYLRYLAIALIIPACAYVALLFLATTPAYCAYDTSSADLSPCYKFLVRDRDADILLVGDSSLLYGVDPAVVRRVSGRTSYNYGIVGASFAFQPYDIIDHYLATNRRPRAIIVYLNPWRTLEPGAIRDPIWFPAGLQVLQHGGPRELFGLLRAHPFAAAETPQIVFDTFRPWSASSAGRRRAMEAAGGFFDYAAATPADRRLLDCPRDPPPGAVRADAIDTGVSRAPLARLRARYAALGVPLYVYAAPFARCHADVAGIRRAYRGLSDNLPAALPADLFTKEVPINQAVHVNHDGQQVVSRLLGEFIVAHDIGGAR